MDRLIHHGMAPFSLLQRVQLQIHMLMCKRALNPAETEIVLPSSKYRRVGLIYQNILVI